MAVKEPVVCNQQSGECKREKVANVWVLKLSVCSGKCTTLVLICYLYYIRNTQGHKDRARLSEQNNKQKKAEEGVSSVSALSQSEQLLITNSSKNLCIRFEKCDALFRSVERL